MKTVRLLLAVCAWAMLAHAGEAPLVIADFEDGTPNPFAPKNCSVVAEHAAHGAKALKLDGDNRFINAGADTGLPQDWSRYDLVKMEVFNPSAKNLKLYIQIRDSMVQGGYWAWHNRYTALAPGANTVQFAVADLWRGEVLRHDVPGALDSKDIRALNMGVDGACYLDYVRLEAFPVAKIEVPGLKAFKIGKTGTPGFPGFAQLTEKDAYSKEKGYGWTKSGFGNMFDRIHPDNLFRSWISCTDAELAIDLPNGKYRVHLQLEDPAYWEFMQHYKQRMVSAEGQVVVNETMDAAEFKKRYFRNQDAEDFPDEDPFEKYVETRHPWHVFDAEVADGQLNLTFQSPDTYGNTLSALILYPVEQAEKGKQFMEFVKGLRKFDWSQAWKPVSKPPAAPVFAGKMAEDAQARGFVLYKMSPYEGHTFYGAFPYDRVPTDDQKLDVLDVTAAQGEFEPCCFGLRPAKPLGKVEVTLSPLKSAAGAEIPAGNVALWVGRYRFTRFQNPQTGLYSVNERELRPFNRTEADTLRCEHLMARRFWISVHVPENATPGQYEAQVTVKAEKGGQVQTPLRVTVLPFKLPDPEHHFAMYGAAVCPIPYYPEMKATYMQDVERLYRDLSAHGINYTPEAPFTVQCQWNDGKAVVTNLEEVDTIIKLGRSLGFKDGPVGFPGGCSMDELAGGGPVKGVPRQKFIEGWHKTLTDLAKERGWPHPNFCYGDEPNLPDTLKKLTAINRAVHEVSPEIWMAIAYHLQNKEGQEMLETLDVHHLKSFCKVEEFQAAKKAGKFLMNCNVGGNRLPYGLREWRATQERKTDGCVTYSYTGNHVDVYYDLDAREDDRGCAPPRADGSLATTAVWERIREGIDDFRYARALENLQKDPRTPKELGAAAAKLLEQALELGADVTGKDEGPPTIRLVTWRSEAQHVLTQAAAK